MKPKPKPATITMNNVSVANNHPALPDGHVDAIQALARALEANAVAIGQVAEALKGPDNRSVGINF